MMYEMKKRKDEQGKIKIDAQVRALGYVKRIVI